MTNGNRSPTDTYYNTRAEQYHESTRDIDMTDLYNAFVPHLPLKGRILDAGCGSGRNALYFKNQEFEVVTMDASSEMVRLSSQLLGAPTLHMRFDEIAFEQEFDGIWASASLLHVEGEKLPGIFQKLCRALKVGGVLFCSFKEGKGEVVASDGRFFNNQTADSLRRILQKIPEFQEVQLWTTINDASSASSVRWLNGVFRKQPTKTTRRFAFNKLIRDRWAEAYRPFGIQNVSKADGPASTSQSPTGEAFRGGGGNGHGPNS